MSGLVQTWDWLVYNYYFIPVNISVQDSADQMSKHQLAQSVSWSQDLRGCNQLTKLNKKQLIISKSADISKNQLTQEKQQQQQLRPYQYLLTKSNNPQWCVPHNSDSFILVSLISSQQNCKLAPYTDVSLNNYYYFKKCFPHMEDPVLLPITREQEEQQQPLFLNFNLVM